MGAPRVEWLTVAADAEAWRSIGLTVTDDGRIPLLGTSLRIAPTDDASPDEALPGVTGWAFSGIDPTEDISGLPTEVVPASPPAYTGHPLGAIDLDHLVVVTDALEETAAAIMAATGCELKRIREVGSIRQGFHRIGRGGLIVELVEQRERAAAKPADAAPTNGFWGLVINVEDLDAAYELLGADRMSAPKDAVQPGRRIATVSADVGLGLPVALMTREQR